MWFAQTLTFLADETDLAIKVNIFKRVVVPGSVMAEREALEHPWVMTSGQTYGPEFCRVTQPCHCRLRPAHGAVRAVTVTLPMSPKGHVRLLAFLLYFNHTAPAQNNELSLTLLKLLSNQGNVKRQSVAKNHAYLALSLESSCISRVWFAPWMPVRPERRKCSLRTFS